MSKTRIETRGRPKLSDDERERRKRESVRKYQRAVYLRTKKANALSILEEIENMSGECDIKREMIEDTNSLKELGFIIERLTELCPWIMPPQRRRSEKGILRKTNKGKWVLEKQAILDRAESRSIGLLQARKELFSSYD